MKTTITLTFFIVFSSLVFSQPDLNFFEKKGEIYFKFSVSEEEEINILTRIISIDNVEGKIVYAYANKEEFHQFLKYEYEYEVLKSPGDVDDVHMFSAIEEIDDWNVYPTYDAYVNMMYQFESNYPAICKVIDAGNSVQGRKILFAKISDNVNEREAEPQFMYTSTMHGDETTGYVLMLRLIDSLLSSYGNDERITNLINSAEIWINPLANPDGTYRSGNNTVSGATRYNYNNYDLNRNFPDPVNGVHSNQQPETTVFRNLQEANNFLLIANFHGGAEVMNYPWDRWSNTGSNSRVHADQSWYQFICRLYADTAQLYSPSGYMTYLNNGITNGGAWYVITGGRQDYTNFYRWGREVTVEISNTKLPNASLLPNFWEYNKRSLLNYMESVLYGVRGIITDTVGTPVKAKVSVISHDIDNSQVWSDSATGFYLRMLSPGTYSFKFEAAEHYDTTITNVVLSSYFSVTELDVRMTPLVPVPVELASFSAQADGNSVYLNWETSTETNNFGFEIERSNFRSQKSKEYYWEKVGFAAGKGTTTEKQYYNFTDRYLASGKYAYRLKQIDFDGSFEFSKIIEVEVNNPGNFSLSQNYPNPFNPSTIISYKIPEQGYVSLKVYDVLGNEVALIINDEKPAGSYDVNFDASGLSSGVYFYKLQSGNFVETKKMILLR